MPSACVFVSPVHSPACRSARPAISSTFPLTRSLSIKYPPQSCDLNRCPSPADELEDQCDHRQHQQQMNKSTHGVTAHYAQQPQDEQHYKDCPKHLSPTHRFKLAGTKPAANLED